MLSNAVDGVVSRSNGNTYFNRKRTQKKRKSFLFSSTEDFFCTLPSLFNLHQSPSTCIICKIYKLYNDDGHIESY